MKRILLVAGLLISVSSFAQFFQGWGIMAGATAGRQYWYYQEPAGREKQRYLLRWNGEIFAEFGRHPNYRWVTELQYNAKGTKEIISGEKPLNHYGAWNNYLMIRHEMYKIIPYVKVGPRLEYVVKTPQSFKPFHVTGSVGAGIEFVAYGRIKFLTELHWVPDVTRSYEAGTPEIKQHCWELRVGIKFGKMAQNCPGVDT